MVISHCEDFGLQALSGYPQYELCPGPVHRLMNCSKMQADGLVPPRPLFTMISSYPTLLLAFIFWSNNTYYDNFFLFCV